MKKIVLFWAMLSVAVLAFPKEGQNPAIAVVKTAQGQAVLLRGSQTVPAVVGERVLAGDVLKTGPGSSLGLIFKDDAILSLGPSSEVVMDEFIFAPAEKKLSFLARVQRGTADFVTGTIGKLSPQSVQIRTPKAIIGIRGTHILIKVDESSR